MKNLLLFIFSIALLFSCQQKINEEAALEYATEKRIVEINNTLELMWYYFDNYSRSRFNGQDVSPLDLRAIAEAERITGWKQEYLISGKDEHLLAYADSVVNSLDYKWIIYRNEKSKSIASQISTCKRLVLMSKDISNRINLFYWTLQAESALVSNQAQKFGGNDSFILPHKIYLNKENFQPGNTVFASFKLSIHKDYLDSCIIDFDSLTVTHVPTNQIIKRKIVQIRQFVLVKIVPQKPGEYFIRGKVPVTIRRKYNYGRQLELWGNKSFIVK